MGSHVIGHKCVQAENIIRTHDKMLLFKNPLPLGCRLTINIILLDGIFFNMQKGDLIMLLCKKSRHHDMNVLVVLFIHILGLDVRLHNII